MSGEPDSRRPGLRPETPLTDDEFGRLMANVGPFEAGPRVAVAVSGGADSMALALLAGRWAESRGGRATGLTVDHGLRAVAADEARRVGAWLKALGVGHRVLRWAAPAPDTGVQAAARRARYGLLEDWCRDAGVLHLLLAHTLDDQAETVLLRLAAGSGPDGLAAMAAVRETPNARLLRPLLGVPKSTLRLTLEARGQDWIEDPSNRDPAFARTRVRGAIEGGDWAPEALAQAAHRFGRARAALEAATSRLLARAAGPHPAGFIRLCLGPVREAPEDVSLRALARVIAAVGGGAYSPPTAKLERLHSELMTGRGGTLGGCRVVAGRDPVLVCRENRNLPAPVVVGAGERIEWDRRFRLAFQARPGGAGRTARLAGLGDKGWAEVVGLRPELRETAVPAPARPVLPALIDDAGVFSVPNLGYRRPGPGPAVDFESARFRPPTPLSGVGFALPTGPGVLSL